MKKEKALKQILTALVLMTVLLLAGCGSGSGDDSGSDAAGSGEGSLTLASFTAETEDGNTWTADDLQSADVTMVNVWGTFCGPCVNEMPEIAELEKQLPENVTVVLCCGDYSDQTAADCESILSDAGYSGTNLIGFDGDLNTLLAGTQFYPTTYFFDSEGNQVAEPVVGAPDKPKQTYLDSINQGLESLGKEGIELE